MMYRPAVLSLFAFLMVAAAGPVAAQSASDTFCVRVSREVQPENLNRLIRQKKVTVRVLDDADCGSTQPATRTTMSVTSLDDFSDHVLSQVPSYVGYFDTMAVAGDEFDLAAMERALAGLQSLATREVNWLDSHPPANCYQGLHREWRSINSAYESAAGTALRGVRDLDVDLIEDGAMRIGAASGRLSVLSEDMTTYALACSA